MERELKIGGIYRHFKGKEMLYEVIEEAIDSETLEKIVIYKSLYEHGNYKKGTVWARNKSNFLARVDENKENPNNQEYRFEYIGEDIDA